MSTIKSFWDLHPEVRDLAARLDADGCSYERIQLSVGKQFGADLVPSRTQIYSLRKGILSGRWTVPNAEEEPESAPEPESKPESATKPACETGKPPQKRAKRPNWDASAAGMPLKARTLIGMQCVACRVKGMITLSGKGCLGRQLRSVGRKNGRKWVVSAGNLAMHPGFSACVGCPHWLTDTELAATAEIIRGKPPPRAAHDGERIL